MPITQAAAREVAPQHSSTRAPSAPALGTPNQDAPPESRSMQTWRHAPPTPSRAATDDEILGLDVSSALSPSAVIPRSSPGRTTRNLSSDADGEIPRPEERTRDDIAHPADSDSSPEPENLRAALDANPELRRAWQDAQSYRETFATPEEARAATALLADLDRMDVLFFSRRPEDHAELARAVANLDPEAFASLAQTMTGLATEAQRHGANVAANTAAEAAAAPRTLPVIPNVPMQFGGEESAVAPPPVQAENQKQIPRRPQGGLARDDNAPLGPTPAQAEFFHAANAAAVEGVLDAIESQIDRLLPEGVSKSARNRVVGEIYRELDATLQSNRQLSHQMREAFKSGAMDANHQRALVSLVTGRARQALPGVAKRVLSEWTSTVVAANHDRRARQRAAERRIDIGGAGGAGNDGPRSMTPRDIDYARLSDSDILNL